MNYKQCLESIVVILAATASCLATTTTTIYNDQAPMILYRKALDTCAHIWNQVEHISDSNMPTLSEVELCQLDAAIGRLLYLVLCFKGLRADGLLTLEQDDIKYLLTVIDGLNGEYDLLFARFAEYERMITTKHVIHVLHRQLRVLLKRA